MDDKIGRYLQETLSGSQTALCACVRRLGHTGSMRSEAGSIVRVCAAAGLAARGTEIAGLKLVMPFHRLADRFGCVGDLTQPFWRSYAWFAQGLLQPEPNAC
ncbi:MAG: hypothetical protein JNJ94_11175 [Chlorobi bacterium]|nr:hypothetical protein [Chlorobiota bacterium]